MTELTTRTPALIVVLRWTARLLSLAAIGILALFAFGEGTPTRSDWLLLAFFPIGLVLGLVAAWWREIPGALLALGSIAAFYVIFFAARGNMPSGPYFAILASPAAVFLLVGLLARGTHARHPITE